MANDFFKVKEGILNENGFVYNEKLNKWINPERGKVFHGDWVKATDTSNLIKTVKESLEGEKNLAELKNALHEILRLGTHLSEPSKSSITQQYVRIDRILYKILGERWL